MTTTSQIPPVAMELLDVQLDDIDPHPKNPRTDLGDIAGLTASIKDKGVMAPLHLHTEGSGRFLTMAGHRRRVAAKKAGRETVPAIVYTGLSEDAILEHLYMENLQHEHLTVSEQAVATVEMIGLGNTVAELATRIGKSKAWVTQRVNLMALPKEVRELCDWDERDGGITIENALKLSRYATDHADVLIEWAQEDGSHDIWGVERRLDEAIARKKYADALQKLLDNGERVFTNVDDLSSEGAAIVTENPNNTFILPGKPKRLAIDPTKHRKEACHANLLHQGYGEVKRFEVCTQPAQHGPKGGSNLSAPVTAGQKASTFEKAERVTIKENNTATLVALQHAVDNPSDVAVRTLIEDGQLDRLPEDAAKNACLLLGLDKKDWPAMGTYEGASTSPSRAVKQYAAESKKNRQRALVAVEIGQRTRYSTVAADDELLKLAKAAGFKPTPMPKRSDFDG